MRDCAVLIDHPALGSLPCIVGFAASSKCLPAVDTMTVRTKAEIEQALITIRFPRFVGRVSVAELATLDVQLQSEAEANVILLEAGNPEAAG